MTGEKVLNRHRKRSLDLCKGPLLSGILRYTVPIILSGLLQNLFNAADLVVVGRFCGSISVAAVGATSSLANLIITLFIGLSVGVGVTTAQGLGAQDDNIVRRTVHTAIPAACISGLLLTAVGVFCAKPLLTWMSTPDDVLPLSTLYMQLFFCGMVANMVYNFGSAILRAAGETKQPLYYLTIAGVLNVLLNVFFVAVLHLDVAGVALATATSQFVSAILVLIALMRRKDACRLTLKQMRIDLRILKRILRIGLPAGLQGVSFGLSNVLIQSSVNSFGSAVVSGNAAAGNIEGFAYIAMNSFHQTALNYTGQNVGAKQYDRVKKIAAICLMSVGIAGLVLGAGIYLLARPLLSLYITDSEQALYYGTLRMAYIGLPYFLCGLMDVITGVIRGMGTSFVPMLITLIGVCGMRVGWIYTVFQIPQYHTLQSLFISYPISWAITFLAQLLLFVLVYQKRKRLACGGFSQRPATHKKLAKLAKRGKKMGDS